MWILTIHVKWQTIYLWSKQRSFLQGMKLLLLSLSFSKSEKCLYNPHEALCSSPGHTLCNRANQPIFVGNGNSTISGVAESFCDETFYDFFGHVSELHLYCQQLGGKGFDTHCSLLHTRERVVTSNNGMFVLIDWFSENKIFRYSEWALIWLDFL